VRARAPASSYFFSTLAISIFAPSAHSVTRELHVELHFPSECMSTLITMRARNVSEVFRNCCIYLVIDLPLSHFFTLFSLSIDFSIFIIFRYFRSNEIVEQNDIRVVYNVFRWHKIINIISISNNLLIHTVYMSLKTKNYLQFVRNEL